MWTTAAIALGYYAFIRMRAVRDQIEAGRMLKQFRKSATIGKSPKAAGRVRLPTGGLVGRVEIPRLDLSVAVFEGTDAKTLSRGAGHLEESARPGETGNVVLAGHRDTFFRSLRGVRPGDTLTLETADHTYEYVVQSTRVVEPADTGVLLPTPEDTVTLVTCYPFWYIGPAPQRFIVRATSVDTSVRQDTRLAPPVTKTAVKLVARRVRKHAPLAARRFVEPPIARIESAPAVASARYAQPVLDPPALPLAAAATLDQEALPDPDISTAAQPAMPRRILHRINPGPLVKRAWLAARHRRKSSPDEQQ